jgi:hypothetical protein
MSAGRPIILAASLVLAAVAPATAQDFDPGAEPMHIGLIIGNSKYAPGASAAAIDGSRGVLPALPNACGDAKTVAAGLVQIGWREEEFVQKCDLTTTEMLGEIRAFVDKIQENPYSIAVFYYAGHGIKIDKSSYIFGVDARPNLRVAKNQIARNNNARMFFGSALEVSADLVSAVGLITEGGFTVILDACRSDPLIEALSGGPRKVTAPISNSFLLPGVLVAVSTQDGETAADNGLYASKLRERMRPKIDAHAIFNRVNTDVFNATKLYSKPQIPTMSGGLVIPCLAGCNLAGEEAWGGEQHSARDRPIQLAQLEPKHGRAAVQNDTPVEMPKSVSRDSSSRINTLYSNPGLATLQQMRGVRVDVFYCEGGARASERENQARDYGISLAERAQNSNGEISSVRLRPLSAFSNGLPVYRFLDNAVVADRSDPAEAKIAKGLLQNDLTGFEQYYSSSTPNYVSVFFCETSPRETNAKVFWHAPAQSEQELAMRLIDGLESEKGQFLSSSKVEIIADSPEKTEVRYYDPDDRDVAFRLADSLQRALKHEVTAKLLVMPKDKSSAGTLEVWIGKGELSLAPSDVKPGSLLLPSRNNILKAAAFEPN